MRPLDPIGDTGAMKKQVENSDQGEPGQWIQTAFQRAMATESRATGCWLITGGCGFIGTALIGNMRLNMPRTAIRVLDNLSVGTTEDLERAAGVSTGNSVELMVGDITDADVCLCAAKGVDKIIHLAANTGVGPSVRDPVADMENNVRGTLNMLEAAKKNGVGGFIFASSGAPVGEVTPPIHEEMPLRPASPYGASKMAGEGYCSAYYRSFGVKTMSLRFGNVYGPGSSRKSSVVAKFIKQAMAGRPCEIYGDGTQTRDFIFVEDLVSAIVKAATSAHGENAWGEVYQIASNREHTVNELAVILKAALTKKGVYLQTRHGGHRVGDVRRNYSDTSKAARVLNWSATVSLEEGIARTVAWFLRDLNGTKPVSEKGSDKEKPISDLTKGSETDREKKR